MGGMTSRERVIRAIRREPTDCVAAMPYMYDIAAVTAGVSLRDFYTDPRTMVEAQLVLHEKVGQDVIAIGADNYYIAEGFGCITTRSEDELPSLETPPLADINDVFDLEVPDPYKDGRMPVMLEGIRLARQAVGEEAVVRSPGTGPFALASYLIGTQEWLMEIALIEAGIEGANEKAVLHALELTTEALIRFGKACWDAGADILHNGDSLASCNVISPRTYERFAYPYQKRVFTAWAEHGVTRKLLHICGDSTKVLHLYADTGADMVEIDNAVDMAVAKRLIGDRVAVVGNVHTVTELLQGTPESVATSAQRCIGRRRLWGRLPVGVGLHCASPRRWRTCRRWCVAHSQPYPGM